jgi:hypothetical protein
MKMPGVLQNLLTNKIVLNIVCVLSALNIIGYLAMGKITAILFFIVLAILITQFNKNMIIVLGVPLILVNLFVAKGYSFVEGAETMGGDNGATTSTSSNTNDDSTAMTPPKAEALKKVAQKAQDKKTSGGLPMTSLSATSATQNAAEDTPEENNESFEVGRAKRRGAGPQIDYAATVEDAYDNLNSILGGEGIQKLTGDTQKLMKQQMQLAESMTAMEPMIASLGPMMKQAQGMMNGLGDNKGMSDLMAMASKMGITGKKE